MDNFEINKIRSCYPVLDVKCDGKKLIYLDSACSALKPGSVTDAVRDYYDNFSCCAGTRSSHLLSIRLTEKLDAARAQTARFIGSSDAASIIWTQNATQSLNLIANSLDYSIRNEVVVTDYEHHSNLLPFHRLAQRGVIKLKILETEDNGHIDEDRISEALNERTVLISFCLMSNITGAMLPVRRLADSARRCGALVAVDASQYAAVRQIRTAELGADFLAFSAHKLGGPTGLGVLYVSEAGRRALSRYQVGGGTVRSVGIKSGVLSAEYLSGPEGWESGIQNYAGILGWKAAMEHLEAIGWDRIASRTGELAQYLGGELEKIPDIKIAGGKVAEGSPMVSFYFQNPEIAAGDFNIFLNQELPDVFIAVRSGHHCAQPLNDRLAGAGRPSVRASFGFYNTREEADNFAAALKKFLS